MPVITTTCANVFCRSRHPPSGCVLHVYDVDGQPNWFLFIRLVLLVLKHSTHSFTFHWYLVHTMPASSNVFSHLTPSAHKKPIVLRWGNHCLKHACLTSLLPATQLNDGILHMASYQSYHVHMWCCISAPTLFLPYNFKIAVTFWFIFVNKNPNRYLFHCLSGTSFLLTE